MHFEDGYFNTYIFDDSDIECFVTHLKQIIDFAPSKFFVPESKLEENEKSGIYNKVDFSSFVKMKLIQSRLFEERKRIHGLVKIDTVRKYES